MSKENTNNVFEADAKTLFQLYMTEGGVAGFKVPEFQRDYDWNKNNINRLFEDILSGLKWIVEHDDTLTFLGTVIVLEEDNKESSFDGTSLVVIDGQQRITTISIISLCLYDKIKALQSNLDPNSKLVDSWITNESNYILNNLLHLIRGVLPANGNFYPFPRIIRENDKRANNLSDLTYDSSISKLLFDFSGEIQGIKTRSYTEIEEATNDRVNDNKIHINGIINDISDNNKYHIDNIASSLIEQRELSNSGIRKLFHKLPSDQSEVDKIFSFCRDKDHGHLGLLRLISFSSYLMNNVIMTLVNAKKEKYAFDIFDSLNTTGEPLTAIQTFKPIVVNNAKQKEHDYKNSYSELYFNKVDEYLNNFTKSQDRQTASKKLIVPFALYMTGEKISEKLEDQRKYLRYKYESSHLSKYNDKLNFIKHLSDVSDFKYKMWDSETIEDKLHSTAEREILLVCIKFLRDLNNSLTIPILCRYYYDSFNQENDQIFTDAVKALTAFIVIRRGATGDTAGIDSDLRKLMSQGSIYNNKPLCIGLEKYNQLPDVIELKTFLIEWLQKKKIEIEDKSKWINRVGTQQLYPKYKTLCKFILLAAYHNARIKNDNGYLLEKERPSIETDCLTSTKWDTDEFSTIEHIAPEKASHSGWDDSILKDQHLINTLGNLTLLPPLENIAASNRDWKYKKILYKAFAAEKRSEAEEIIENAKKEGFNVGNKNKEIIINKGSQLPFMKSIANVENWDSVVIKNRSHNIAELAWDEISTWLFK